MKFARVFPSPFVSQTLHEPPGPTPSAAETFERFWKRLQVRFTHCLCRQRGQLPHFLIRGHLDATSCVISQPLTGEVQVDKSDVPIKSIELQLVRVETCGCAEGYARDATEIQNIQIAEGDVGHGLPIPVHMVFPRLFTCPTLETTNFKVEFEINVVVILQDDHLITENFPLKLCRV
uniref:Uncharacterized protein n=1 Tax=Xiphophorus couchianus TaxID=32473 RepID=A0A3B5LB45_9TELE